VPRGLAALVLCLIALAGCGGGDHESAKDPKAPALTVPETTTTPAPTTDTTTTETTPPATSTATTPSGGGAAPPASPQSNQPPSGSPASRFERFCRENPGACGN
jgi:ABC-type glycerol-3-phosphate transport system substrate-binding protein